MKKSKPHKKQVDLTIVIPALREEKRIGKSLDELAAFLDTDPVLKPLDIEVIVVAADAPDRTPEVAAEKGKRFKDFSVLRPGPKLGKGRDVQYGMLRAHGNAVIYMDADLATPLRHLPRFYEDIQDGADLVIGTRNLRRHHKSFLRRFVSNAGNALFRVAGGVWIEDSQCGFKMFTAEAAHLCFSKLTIMRWGFDMEILTIAKVNKLKTKTRRIDDWTAMPEGTFVGGIVGNTISSLGELGYIFKNRLTRKYVERES